MSNRIALGQKDGPTHKKKQIEVTDIKICDRTYT